MGNENDKLKSDAAVVKEGLQQKQLDSEKINSNLRVSKEDVEAAQLKTKSGITNDRICLESGVPELLISTPKWIIQKVTK